MLPKINVWYKIQLRTQYTYTYKIIKLIVVHKNMVTAHIKHENYV